MTSGWARWDRHRTGEDRLPFDQDGNKKGRATAYDILGLSKTCNKNEAKQAYQKLIKRVHPDKGGDQRQFQQVQKAFQIVLKKIDESTVRGFGALKVEETRQDGSFTSSSAEKFTPSAKGIFDGSSNSLAKASALGNEAKACGNKAFKDGRYDDAIKYYTQAISWLPGDSIIYCNRATALFQEGKYEASLTDALMAVRLSARYAKAWYRCALCYSKLEAHDKAIRYMRRAVELEDENENLKVALTNVEKTAANQMCMLKLMGHSDSVVSAAWQPSFKEYVRPLLATASLDGKVKIWCASSGILLHHLDDHNDKVTLVKWSQDGKAFASASLDKTIRIWQWEDLPACKHILKGHQGRVTSFVFEQSGLRLFTASTDRTAKIWNLENGSCVCTLSGHSDIIPSIAYSQETNKLATASGDGKFKLWNSTHGKCLQTVDWECGHVNLCAFATFQESDQAVIITCHWDRKREFSRILLWDLKGDVGWVDGKLVSHMMHFDGFTGKIVCMHTCRIEEATILAAGSTDGLIKVFEIESGTCLYDISDQHLVSGAMSATVTALQFSPNGSYLATAGLDGKIHIWEAEEGNHYTTFHGHEGKVYSVEWSPCSKRIISVGHDKTAKIWKCNFN